MKNKKKRRTQNVNQFKSAVDSSFHPDQLSQNNMDETVYNGGSNKKLKRQKQSTVVRNADEETVVGSLNESEALPMPYEFLKFASPSIHMIFFPHFTVKSVTFGLTLLLLALFIVLLIFNYTKPQNDFTWNCSLYQLQNKFFPKLRYNFQFWRVPISGFFHSNIAHFCMNVFGLQLYGYFVEWYHGKLKMVVSLIITIIVTHFFAAAVDNESISTMSSSLLYCVVAMKIWFLFEYRNYKPLQFRKMLIYVLLAIIVGMNLIPIFVVNNVEFTSHLGGFIVGGLMGTFFHFRKQEQNLQNDQKRSQYPKIYRVLKWGSLVLIGAFFTVCIAVVFATDSETLYVMNSKIDEKCQT